MAHMNAISSHAGGHVVERKRVTIRGFGKKRKDQDRDDGGANFFFRGPHELKDYVVAAAKAQGQRQDEFIIDAINLDRDLASKLAGDAERLDEFASSRSLSLERDAAEVLAQLVKKGLDCQDVDCSQSKKKK